MNFPKVLYTSLVVAYLLISTAAISSIKRITDYAQVGTASSGTNTVVENLRKVAASTQTQIPEVPTVNVPIYAVTSGNPALDANNRAIVWSGKVSTNDNYFDVRLVGADDGLRVRANIIDSNIVDGEYITFKINGVTKTAIIGNLGPFSYGERCDDSRLECRGWTVDSASASDGFTSESAWSWADFGGKPNTGDKWSLEIMRHDVDANAVVSDVSWAGKMNWGEPAVYYGQTIDGAEVVTNKLVADANIGGSTHCGAPDDPDFFATWGKRSYQGDSYQKIFANVQAQWDTADWPCYAKYILKWQNQGVPANATILKAELMMYRFGHSGYNAGDTATTRVRAYEITENWDENTVSWDTAPLPRENTSYTDVTECTDAGCDADAWRKLDVTEIVRRSRVEGRDWSSAMLYTAAGQYHSGKYFYTREHGELYPYVKIYYTNASVADPTPTTIDADPNPTNPPNPTNIPPINTQTDILDDFNREDEQVGRPAWAGAVTNYDVAGNELVLGGHTHTYWYPKKFGKDQTVFYTIKNIGAVTDTTAFGLLAKSQSNLGNNNLAYIAYFPKSQKLRVYTTASYQTKLQSEKSGVTFAPGDKMSLQIDALGKLVVKRNADVVHTFNLKGKWGSYAKEGWVGIYAKDAGMVIVDDFGVMGSGGTGTVTTVTPPMATPTGLVVANPTATPIVGATTAPTAIPTSGTSGPSPTRAPVSSNTYWLGLSGSDRNDGKTNQTPIRSFGRAWEILMPGDTLNILDGTYTEPIQPNIRNGQPGAPITIRAVNDGKVIIDGRGENIPVRFGENWGPNGAIGDWFVLEGIVAINGTIANFRIEHGNNNIMRRVSGYNASPDENSQVFAIVWSNNNLVEDCIAAGTGRYMTQNFTSKNNTYRRCFTMWQKWDGKNFCGVSWPNGNNMGIYNSSDSTIENGIAYGRSLTGIFIQANDDAAVANNNQVLGSMSLLQGKDYNNTKWQFGAGTDQPSSRPGPIVNPYGDACPNNITQWDWGGHRMAFSLYGQGELQNNVFRDILALDSVGVGWHAAQPHNYGIKSNNVIDYATSFNNGSDIMSWENKGRNIYIGINGVKNPTNSKIANSEWANQGAGARFQYRYENRKLTTIPLLPWPMESRAKEEMGLSIESVIGAAKAKAAGTNPPWPAPQGGTMLAK